MNIKKPERRCQSRRSGFFVVTIRDEEQALDLALAHDRETGERHDVFQPEDAVELDRMGKARVAQIVEGVEEALLLHDHADRPYVDMAGHLGRGGRRIAFRADGAEQSAVFVEDRYPGAVGRDQIARPAHDEPQEIMDR
ncbi:hypothetical protein [Ciceribacter selenitireducens]